MDEWQYEAAERMQRATARRAAEAAAQANAPQYHPDFDGKHCVGCGEAIPAGRLALGKVRCTACQELEEMRHG